MRVEILKKIIREFFWLTLKVYGFSWVFLDIQSRSAKKYSSKIKLTKFLFWLKFSFDSTINILDKFFGHLTRHFRRSIRCILSIQFPLIDEHVDLPLIKFSDQVIIGSKPILLSLVCCFGPLPHLRGFKVPGTTHVLDRCFLPDFVISEFKERGADATWSVGDQGGRVELLFLK